MKEPLLAAVVSNEAEPSVSDESLDRAAWHSRLLGHIGAQETIINFRSTSTHAEGRANIDEAPAHAPSADEKKYACVRGYFTLTVITEHAPATVLWRSSPS
jgi:hypothetical protein